MKYKKISIIFLLIFSLLVLFSKEISIYLNNYTRRNSVYKKVNYDKMALGKNTRWESIEADLLKIDYEIMFNNSSIETKINNF